MSFFSVFLILELNEIFQEKSRIFFSLIHSLIEEGGDWDRRNRLKVYQGLYCVSIRNFKDAANFFLDTVSTFTSYELMDYNTFVRYTVYVGMIALPRNELRDKVHYFETNCIFLFSSLRYKFAVACM